MTKKGSVLVVKLWLEDFQYSSFNEYFEDENAIREFVKHYLDGNNKAMVEIQNQNGKTLHKFELGVGSHNQMKLYDLV